MTKKLLLCIFFPLLSQVCGAAIIIDLDIYLNEHFKINTVENCGNQGCAFPLLTGVNSFMMVQAPNGTAEVFHFSIAERVDTNYSVVVHGITSPTPNEYIRFALPEGTCSDAGQTTLGYIRLLGCSFGNELARVYFFQVENTLRVYMVPIEPGLTLKTITGVTNYALTVSPVPYELHTGEPTVDRGEPHTKIVTPHSVFPNPFSQSIMVHTNATESQSIQMQLLNANGQVFYNQLLKGGQDDYPLQTGELPTGVYYLRVQIDNRSYLHRMVKME